MYWLVMSRVDRSARLGCFQRQHLELELHRHLASPSRKRGCGKRWLLHLLNSHYSNRLSSPLSLEESFVANRQIQYRLQVVDSQCCYYLAPSTMVVQTNSPAIDHSTTDSNRQHSLHYSGCPSAISSRPKHSCPIASCSCRIRQDPFHFPKSISHLRQRHCHSDSSHLDHHLAICSCSYPNP